MPTWKDNTKKYKVKKDEFFTPRPGDEDDDFCEHCNESVKPYWVDPKQYCPLCDKVIEMIEDDQGEDE